MLKDQESSDVKLLKLDERTFENLFKASYKDLCRFAFKYINEEESAREIVQELFIQLWQNRDNLNIHSSLESYLYSSARNRSLNYVKRRLYLRNTHEEIYLVSSEEHDPIYDEINYKELKTAVDSSIAELPERCKMVFHLSRNEGLSHKEISSRMDISEKTVENQISIALKKLRENLQEFFCLIFFLFLQ